MNDLVVLTEPHRRPSTQQIRRAQDISLPAVHVRRRIRLPRAAGKHLSLFSQHGFYMHNQIPVMVDLLLLERPQPRCTDHFSNTVADREFSTGCYLFTVSNSGLLLYTKRVSTTPSQPRPLPSPTPFGNSSIDIKLHDVAVNQSESGYR